MPEDSMGYEMYMDALCEQAQYSNACRTLEMARNPEWKMKDGTKIKLKDMEESHIKNCIGLLTRSPCGDYGNIWLNKFDKELQSRKEHPNDRH